MDSFNQTKEAFLSKKPPFLDILGFEDCSFDKSNEEFSCIFIPSIKMTHSNGTIVQGGFISGMLDSAMAQIVLYRHNFTVNPLTLKMDVTFILPCKPEKVICKSKILKMGKSIVFTTAEMFQNCLLYTSPSPRDQLTSRMPSSA